MTKEEKERRKEKKGGGKRELRRKLGFRAMLSWMEMEGGK